LPDTPAADVFDFIAMGFLDFAPLEDGYANSFAQVIYVKHFAKIDIARIKAAGNSMRGSEWANDGHTLGQHCKINEVSLGTLRQVVGEWRKKELTYVMTLLARLHVRDKRMIKEDK
jgi:hypothetical protein